MNKRRDYILDGLVSIPQSIINRGLIGEMHIIFGIERYWPASGGAEDYIRSIAQTLARHNHIVTVVTLARDDIPLTPYRRSIGLPDLSKEWDGSVRIVGLPISNRDRIFLSPILLQTLPIKDKRVSNRLRTIGFEQFAQVLFPEFTKIIAGADLIHTVAPWEMSHLANLAKNKLGIPHLITGLIHPGFWADDIHSTTLYKQCDYIIALLNSEMEKYIEIGIPSSKIEVIGTPTPESLQLNSPPIQLKFSAKSPVILFLGVKRWYKGCDLILEAAPYVWEKIPQAIFLFLGPRSEESKALFSHLSDPRIIEVDKVPDKFKNAALDLCNVLCLPSATEIMPNVILEAWSAGKPVVVSNIPTLVELVTGAGLCVKREPESIANALIQILCNTTLAKRLGTEGKRRAREEYSTERIVSALERVYYKCIT